MNSIRGEAVALDTNVFIFALRKEPNYPACETLLFDKLTALQVYMPLQIFLELQRNLTASEMRRIVRALTMAQAVTWDYAPARMDLIRQWEQRGAKKGDAVITAHLEVATIRYLVSENRDFLKELPDLPFTVLSSEEAVRLLGESGS
ncbi:MAG TPA: type II toxin-antitoxin system VapC family toxin [Candidatus Tectomicrobia bacterium]|nr:type II toxin-antitoxin system VapC family toxin [Candidatus Tectomicrobia bacterium]